MNEGLSELDALKRLITERNTVYRTFNISGNSVDDALANAHALENKYARELSNEATNNTVNRVRTGAAPLYTTSNARGDNYIRPRFALIRMYGDNQFNGAYRPSVYPSQFPKIFVARTVKLTPKLNFEGDPTT